MVNMGEMFAHPRLINPEMELVPMSDVELAKFDLRAGDLLFARQSLILEGAGKCSIVKQLPEDTTFESHLIRVRLNTDIANPDFYFYYLNSSITPVKSIVTQGVQAGIRASELSEIQVFVPELGTQHRIAAILAAYDDMIEINRRRIKLLEGAARLIYREWFVRLRFPGHEHTKIENGLPEGWHQAAIADLTDFLSRGISPSYDDDAPGLVINQKCIRDGLLDLGPARRQSKKVPNSKLVLAGDVLVNSTGAGTLGRVAQVLEEIPDCTVDSHVTIVRPREDLSQAWFGMALVSMQSVIEGMGKGATNQTELSKTDLGELKLSVPSKLVSDEFDQLVSPLRRQVQVLRNQCKALQSARDLLLPRLMSGEIEV